MKQRFHSATIENAWETLHDPFSPEHKHKLPVAVYRDGEQSYLGFSPCTITGEQAGCVSLLLWKAGQLDRQVARQKRLINRLQRRLHTMQTTIDRSIANLDPDR
jgi:hypothetical protein